jgi:hypothetical protein
VLIHRTRNTRVLAAAVLLTALPLIAFATRCTAQEPENQDHDAALTPEQWQQRVGEARRRSEEFVARTRTQTEDPVSSQKEILLQKSFCAGGPKFCGVWASFSLKVRRDLVASR